MTRTVVHEFDEAVDVRTPADDGRAPFSARLHGHAVDDAGDWAQVSFSGEGVTAVREWVPLWWVYRSELTDDDGLVGRGHLRLLP